MYHEYTYIISVNMYLCKWSTVMYMIYNMEEEYR